MIHSIRLYRFIAAYHGKHLRIAEVRAVVVPMMVGVVKILVKHIKGVHSKAALILFRDIDLRQKVVGQTGLYPAYHINVGIFFYVINKEFKLRVLCSGFVNVLRLCVKSGRAFGKRVCVCKRGFSRCKTSIRCSKRSRLRRNSPQAPLLREPQRQLQ